MTDLNAIELIENKANASLEETIEAWQALLDSGTIWRLQGFYCRNALSLIEDGIIFKKENKTQRLTESPKGIY
jgi:hypothetical protein